MFTTSNTPAKVSHNDNKKSDLEQKGSGDKDIVKIERVEYSEELLDRSLPDNFTYRNVLSSLQSLVDEGYDKKNDVGILKAQLTRVAYGMDETLFQLIADVERFMSQYKTGEIYSLLGNLYLLIRKAERNEQVEEYQRKFGTLKEVIEKNDYHQAKILLRNLFDYAKSILTRENSQLHDTLRSYIVLLHKKIPRLREIHAREQTVMQLQSRVTDLERQLQSQLQENAKENEKQQIAHIEETNVLNTELQALKKEEESKNLENKNLKSEISTLAEAHRILLQKLEDEKKKLEEEKQKLEKDKQKWEQQKENEKQALKEEARKIEKEKQEWENTKQRWEEERQMQENERLKRESERQKREQERQKREQERQARKEVREATKKKVEDLCQILGVGIEQKPLKTMSPISGPTSTGISTTLFHLSTLPQAVAQQNMSQAPLSLLPTS